ncbi:hypothetical protein SAMN05444365_101744 [Micromonospora pattaloongensis]|uniref:Uncharacterized protein n=1 Tax=Micromonospora pattaloongensis TaxID=405436 RepID=A0A1H3H9U1_9ACTN|nr:hypothetical protein [Micromonospora pattaloongensis]SDY12252.1 hypothetical protein SAMN05444365_101744 [Micromonospora pattaloongensis]
MRGAVGFLVKGILRSRVGIALALAVIVLGVVGLARVLAGPNESSGLLTGTPNDPLVTVTPTTGDDGLVSVPPPPSPTARPGTPPPETVARSFAAAWVDHRDVPAARWRDRLRPLSTAELAGKLAEVDPVSVPADEVSGEPALTPLAAGLVEVAIDLDSGTLRLRLIGPDGRWLVDGVDWERG